MEHADTVTSRQTRHACPSVRRTLRCVWRRLFGFALVLLTVFPAVGDQYIASHLSPPSVRKEMRGVWVATVGNIDWPSTNALTTAQQKAELTALLDRAAELKLNTVIFQVRPACDALYASSLEPWSEYLTGTMGKAPEPYYDPLAFAVEQAHKRGLELHAWFNPYRARHLQARSPVSLNHISKTHPDWVRRYGKELWLDPGEKGVQQHSLRVVMDVVQRYDIDGVHFDDYFYPYLEHDRAGKAIEFPDDASWRRFGSGKGLTREDWRRQNVDNFVRQVYQSIRAAKPWVKFGISPFGIWRPGNPSEIKGLDAFAELYADSRKWLAEGWVDYLSPQLYWGINPPQTSFPTLLSWWARQNPRRRLLCPGLCTSNVGGKWRADEILDQIRLTRGEPGVSGHVHWDMKALQRNPALEERLRTEAYAEPALVPAMPWLERPSLGKPALYCELGKGATRLSWTMTAPQKVGCWVLQTKNGEKWRTQILPRSESSIRFSHGNPEFIALTAVDRCGNPGPPAVLERR
jgi:uncharacterized lipoprotein YddW (UPF0748 family)